MQNCNFDLENVITPINIDELDHLLRASGYEDESRIFLVKGFAKGFSLGYQGPVHRKNRSKNIQFTVGDKETMWSKIMKEVDCGRYAGPFKEIPFENYIQSPIGLVPKDVNKTRLIFHLSYKFSDEERSVNFYTPQELCKVKYKDLDYAVRKSLDLIKKCRDKGNVFLWYGKSDLVSAFRLLPTSPDVWWTMIMVAQDPESGEWCFFIDKCLPFGHCISCALFQKFLDALAHILEYLADAPASGVDVLMTAISNYLDDFLFIALTKLMCNNLLQLFLNMCARLGVPVSLEKTHWANLIITFLGILLNGKHHYLAVPEDKRIRALNELQLMTDRKKAKVHDLQKSAGFLNFLNRAITPGRAFTRRMYAKFTGFRHEMSTNAREKTCNQN